MAVKSCCGGRVGERLQSAPRLRFGLPLRGTSALARESMGETRDASSLPTSFDLAPLALVSGRGAGGEGFCTVF